MKRAILLIILLLPLPLTAQKDWIGWNMGFLSMDKNFSEELPDLSVTLMELIYFNESYRLGFRINALEIPDTENTDQLNLCPMEIIYVPLRLGNYFAMESFLGGAVGSNSSSYYPVFQIGIRLAMLVKAERETIYYSPHFSVNSYMDHNFQGHISGDLDLGILMFLADS